MFTTTSTMITLLEIPPEILLHIFSYLDLPDLTSIAQLSKTFASLAADPALHRNRILVVAPSRVHHHLRNGLRPTIADLVHWGVMRGLGIERRWKAGLYFYSPQSVRQYDTSQRLQRTHVQNVLSTHLHKHFTASSEAFVFSHSLQTLHTARVLPDIESSSPSIARSLLPALHQLKWCIQRDRLSRVVRDRHRVGGVGEGMGVGIWLVGRGRTLIMEGERVRLALCPSVRKLRNYGFLLFTLTFHLLIYNSPAGKHEEV